MQTLLLSGGRWTPAASGAAFPVRNPATDAPLAEVADGGAADARAAVDAAAEAFPRWRALPARERARPLARWADLMLRDRERLARLLTEEQGKPLAEARGEIDYAASFLEWAAGEAVRVGGETIPASTADRRILVLRQPVGVTAAITPWNFPAAMVTRKVAPALAAGCTSVLKPAEQTPLTALALGELAQEAGLPPGVLNLVPARDPVPVVDALFADRRVRKVSFTGSTAVGRLLMAKAAANVTRLSLELGGHAPFLVFEDADLDAAVAGAVATKFRNAGQTCICANRILVHEKVLAPFADRLRAAAEDLRVGNGLEEGVRLGPLIDDAALAKVEDHVADAVARGARVLCGARRVEPGPGLAKRFYAPTVLDRVGPDMKVSLDETFGPVAPITAFRTEEEAIRLANDSRYGLAAYFFTRDASRLMRVAEALDYGIVGANDALPSVAQAPFGGMKESGFGREGGREGMAEYLETKFVSWRL
jgi:succinate-semialdehyde dehydrogenase/glutarate-semialdehyde dehydrogenase